MSIVRWTLIFGVVTLLSSCGSEIKIAGGTYQSGIDGVEPLPAEEPVELLLVDAENMRVILQVDGKTIRDFNAEPTGKWGEGCQTNFTTDRMERWRLIDNVISDPEPVFLSATCDGLSVVMSNDTKSVLFGIPE